MQQAPLGALRLIALLLMCLVLASSCSPSQRAVRQARRALPPGFYEQHGQRMGLALSGREDPRLIREISAWMGVPYRFGGITPSGADCSGFVYMVYFSAYDRRIPRTVEGMADASQRILLPWRLREGDLVFFRERWRKPHHVGIYLGRGYFAHASVSRGVTVNHLDEPYYKRLFAYGGRLPADP